MRLEKDRFGEDVVVYDSPSEAVAAIRSYLVGNLAALTCLEVLQLRACDEDPNGIRWEAEHAGMLAEEVDVLDFNGLVFILDLGRTFEEGRDILLRKIGPHPVTPITLWELERA